MTRMGAFSFEECVREIDRDVGRHTEETQHVSTNQNGIFTTIQSTSLISINLNCVRYLAGVMCSTWRRYDISPSSGVHDCLFLQLLDGDVIGDLSVNHNSIMALQE